MINEIKLSGLRYKVVRIEPGSIKEIKKRLVYQHAVSIDDKDVMYVSLCGSCTIGVPCYALARTYEEPKEREYTTEELRILLGLLWEATMKVKIPRFTEILVRGISDSELNKGFYDHVSSDYFKARIQYLYENPQGYKRDNVHVSLYDRQRYSVYQLVKDLVKDGAEICIDPEIIKYEKISTGHSPRLPEENWVKSIAVQGNKNRANLSILYKLESGSYGSMCFVKDGALHTSLALVRINGDRLKKILYGARVVSDTFIFKNELLLDLEKIPVIGKKFISRVKEDDYLRSCVNLLIQEQAYKFACYNHPEAKEEKERKCEVVKKNEKTRSYTAHCLSAKTNSKGLISYRARKIEGEESDLKVRKKELEKARKTKRDMTFRYLLSKREKFFCSKEVDGVYMSMQLTEKTIDAGD